MSDHLKYRLHVCACVDMMIVSRSLFVVLVFIQSDCINKDFYVAQVFGRRVQENTLFPMARQPDSLQSGLIILHHMENYAKF